MYSRAAKLKFRNQKFAMRSQVLLRPSFASFCIIAGTGKEHS